MVNNKKIKHSWNFGLTKETDERVLKNANNKKGKKPWNVGTKGICKPNSGSFKKGDKTVLGRKKTYQEIENNRIARTGKGKTGIYKNCLICNKEFYCSKCEINKRKCCSRECRSEFMSNNMKGDIDLIKRLKELRKNNILPIKDTKIEVKIQGFLESLGIDYFKHKYMNIEHAYQCDILIPSLNLVIECDGDYWHKYPTGRDIDKIRTSELIEKGFRVLRLWEHEIKSMRINKFKEKLK